LITTIECGEDLFLQRQILEHRFDDHVSRFEALAILPGGNPVETLLDLL